MRSFVLAFLAVAIGYGAWNNNLYLLGMSGLFPLVWSRATSRQAAGFVAFCYYAAAARGLVPGTQIFFGSYGPCVSIFLGLVFLIASSCVLAMPWSLVWARDPSSTAMVWRLPAALILVSIPPVGFLGWANPTTSAGVLFPGWRWHGLAALVSAMFLSLILKRPSHILPLLVLCVLSACLSQDPPMPPRGWKGVDTHFGGLSGQAGFVRFYDQNKHMIETAMDSKTSAVLLFPEAVAGRWNRTTAALWEEPSAHLASQGLTVLFGAELFADRGVGSEQYDAVVIAVGSESGVLYRQRFPMPVSMWRPFCANSARIHWLDSGVFILHGRKFAALVCYEQVLTWPVLISMIQQPEVILAPANAWWSRNTSIPGIQHNVLAAWARLFHIPVITAFNY